jgi:hypothetical protein
LSPIRSAWAAVFCCVSGYGCIPFFISSLKDVNHYCGQRHCKFTTWHRSGKIDVQAHA